MFWRKNDVRILKRIRRLVADMQAHPYTGIGKPEVLRYTWSGFYSRRIDKKNRIVYHVDEEKKLITIHLMRFHYDA